ncbi:MAG: TonB-dependent receptor [Alphaproteobacteria bacterium]|nr:TonB-dependent receptor [Alphaproteobacteria bacterium]
MKSLQRALLCGASVIAAVSAVSVSAFAQSDQSSMETVTVTGVRESLRDSLVMKQSSDLITENISTKDIGQLPDVTIAEELNRLPGLNTTLDRGNASQAAVRGLGPRFVLGLVNGREVASSEPDQNVRWEIYPSEVVSGVQVYKSQSANLLSGGIAATINIKTVDPLDYSGPSFTMRAGPEYNDEANELPHYSPWGMRGSTSYITHLSENFAIALSASFQREKNGYESFQGWGYNPATSWNAGDVTGDGVPDATPWGAQTEVTEIQQDRTAFSGAADWRPNSNLRIKLDALYSGYTIHEDQFQAWYGNGTWGDWTSFATSPPVHTPCDGSAASKYGCVAGVANPNVTTLGGVVVAANLANSYADVQNTIALYSERHTLVVGGLNTEWTQGAWDVKLDLSHSEAARNNDWQAIYADQYPQNMTFDTRAGQSPVVTVSGGGFDVANPAAQVVHTWNPSSTGPEYTRDHISAAQLDGSRTIEGSFFTEFDFGARMSERSKNHRDFQFHLCPVTGSTVGSCSGSSADFTLPASDLSEFTVRDFSVPSMVYGKYETLAPLLFKTTAVPAGSEQLPQHWKVHEGVFEGYLMTSFKSDVMGVPMSGNLGVRISNVATTSSGYSNNLPITVKKNYTDVLPSLNLNFHLSDEQILRFGAAIAVSRPPLDELRTGFSLSTSPPYTGSGGNPFLNPYKVDQVDLDYEWYFHEEALFAAALYYKHLNSFIGYGSTTQDINGTTYTMYSPLNGPGGDVTGLELTFQSRLYFLPGFLKDFGIYSNYAYVNSGLKEFSPVNNPLDATGLAKHTAELDLWYSANDIEARIAYKVHSPFTIIAGWNSQSLTRLDWERTLEASLSYQWNDHIGFRLQGRNLTNEVSRSYWDNNPEELARFDTFGRSFLFDISYKN